MLARILGIVALVAAVILVFFGANIAWRLLPSKTLDVVVVDKTVPFQKYREHAAIPWILHAMKLHARDGHYLDAARDYIGFDPVAKAGRDLTSADLEKADVLVVADTYGVYQGDYEKEGEVAALERSPKIYGGFGTDEVSAVEQFAARGGLVIGEFNTFASPTEPANRARLEALFGVRWTHWVARYWPNLQDENEVPKWVGRLYEKINHHPLDMSGGALVFVHEDDDILVLQDDVDLGSKIVEQQRTKVGGEFDLPEHGNFLFWMDVVEPLPVVSSTFSGGGPVQGAVTRAGAEVLFEHVIDVKTAGDLKLTAHHLPTRFPAVTRRGSAWYFGGDFVDTALPLGDPERIGLLSYKRSMTGCGGGATADEAFFWTFYAPIMTRLFASRAH